MIYEDSTLLLHPLARYNCPYRGGNGGGGSINSTPREYYVGRETSTPTRSSPFLPPFLPLTFPSSWPAIYRPPMQRVSNYFRASFLFVSTDALLENGFSDWTRITLCRWYRGRDGARREVARGALKRNPVLLTPPIALRRHLTTGLHSALTIVGGQSTPAYGSLRKAGISNSIVADDAVRMVP
jgi:hypothetical protein